MAERRTALVAGATGVTGRAIVGHLAETGFGEVVALSRTPPEDAGSFRHVPCDLLDAGSVRDAAGAFAGATHVFFAAYREAGPGEDLVDVNMAMLENLMDAVEPAAPDLRHVNLMHGTKWYGSHLGPFKTPAQEDDPRHMPPNFYYDQQDRIAARAAKGGWTWSAARPHAICGPVVGNPMNLLMVIAVYASISRELGMPLCHPGTEENWRALYQVCSSAHLAKAVTWMATDPGCANEAFNVTNGDVFRWEHMWPRIADMFGMETGPRRRLSLVGTMADKAPVWERIVERHGLRPIPYERLVAWKHGDFVFSAGQDIMSSMTKARRFGFHDVVDSTEMFAELFADLRARRIIP